MQYKLFSTHKKWLPIEPENPLQSLASARNLLNDSSENLLEVSTDSMFSGEALESLKSSYPPAVAEGVVECEQTSLCQQIARMEVECEGELTHGIEGKARAERKYYERLQVAKNTLVRNNTERCGYILWILQKSKANAPPLPNLSTIVPRVYDPRVIVSGEKTVANAVPAEQHRRTETGAIQIAKAANKILSLVKENGTGLVKTNGTEFDYSQFVLTPEEKAFYKQRSSYNQVCRLAGVHYDEDAKEVFDYLPLPNSADVIAGVFSSAAALESSKRKHQSVLALAREHLLRPIDGVDEGIEVMSRNKLECKKIVKPSSTSYKKQRKEQRNSHNMKTLQSFLQSDNAINLAEDDEDDESSRSSSPSSTENQCVLRGGSSASSSAAPSRGSSSSAAPNRGVSSSAAPSRGVSSSAAPSRGSSSSAAPSRGSSSSAAPKTQLSKHVQLPQPRDDMSADEVEKYIEDLQNSLHSIYGYAPHNRLTNDVDPADVELICRVVKQFGENTAFVIKKWIKFLSPKSSETLNIDDNALRGVFQARSLSLCTNHQYGDKVDDLVEKLLTTIERESKSNSATKEYDLRILALLDHSSYKNYLLPLAQHLRLPVCKERFGVKGDSSASVTVEDADFGVPNNRSQFLNYFVDKFKRKYF